MRLVPWIIGALAAALICCLFLVFHIVPLRQAAERQRAAAFDAKAFARNFWDTRLLPACEQATPLAQLLPAMAQEPERARKELGHSPGLTANAYFFVKGDGQITALEKDRISVRLDG